jgi:hypothetical protein
LREFSAVVTNDLLLDVRNSRRVIIRSRTANRDAWTEGTATKTEAEKGQNKKKKTA